MTKPIQLTDENARKAELTLLVIMEDTPRDKRKSLAKKLDVPWKEYKQLVRKYRFLLRKYRKDKGTYNGEFEDTPKDEVSPVDVQQAHVIFDALIKHIHSAGGKL